MFSANFRARSYAGDVITTKTRSLRSWVSIRYLPLAAQMRTSAAGGAALVTDDTVQNETFRVAVRVHLFLSIKTNLLNGKSSSNGERITIQLTKHS